MDTVWKWRKALDVGATTPGTSRLRHEYGIEPAQLENVARAMARARDPERRAKLSAARKGNPRPPHVGRAVAEAHRGTHHSAQTRAKMSATHRKCGTRLPKAGSHWTAEEDALVRTLSAAEVATKTRRSRQAVYDRRHELQVPDGRRRGWGEPEWNGSRRD
jgi:hypothetical protein